MSALLPEWARWQTTDPYTVGAEEEIMLLGQRFELINAADELVAEIPAELAGSVATETHGAALEIATGPHSKVAGVAAELHALRRELERAVGAHGVRLASSGTHPCAQWHGIEVAGGARQRAVYESMRELARREPTFALHVHVGIPDPEHAVRVANRLRAHVPLLLALSANSPFSQGRDSGLASARTPLFQAFPRVGIPRAFVSYDEWVAAVEVMIRAGAFPEPTFLWWDIRLQPRLGTVEVRILDAQTTVDESAALCALVQCIVRLECQGGYVAPALVEHPEVLDENRFLAARDGMDARLIDPEASVLVPARTLLADLLHACAPHATALGCTEELEGVDALAERTGADRQRELAAGAEELYEVVEALAAAFCTSGVGSRAEAAAAPPVPEGIA